MVVILCKSIVLEIVKKIANKTFVGSMSSKYCLSVSSFIYYYYAKSVI